MPDKEIRVELHNAYVWDCPDCGRENFVRAVMVEFSPADVPEMIDHHGGEPEDWQTGEWFTRPDDVTCKHCAQEFGTEDVGGDNA